MTNIHHSSEYLYQITMLTMFLMQSITSLPYNKTTVYSKIYQLVWVKIGPTSWVNLVEALTNLMTASLLFAVEMFVDDGFWQILANVDVDEPLILSNMDDDERQIMTNTNDDDGQILAMAQWGWVPLASTFVTCHPSLARKHEWPPPFKMLLSNSQLHLYYPRLIL